MEFMICINIRLLWLPVYTNLKAHSKVFVSALGVGVVHGIPTPSSFRGGHGLEDEVRAEVMVATQLVDLLSSHEDPDTSCVLVPQQFDFSNAPFLPL